MNHNKNISYLRIRPCDSDNEIYLNSRAKEGTSSFTLKPDPLLNYESLLVKGFQTISSDLSGNSSAWFITDANINTEIKHNSKRLIYRYKENKENALEIISRVKPSVVLIENLEDIDFLLSLNGITKFKISNRNLMFLYNPSKFPHPLLYMTKQDQRGRQNTPSWIIYVGSHVGPSWSVKHRINRV